MEVLSLRKIVYPGTCAHAHTLLRHAEVHVQVVVGLQIRHFKVIYGTLLYIIDIKQICKFVSIK